MEIYVGPAAKPQAAPIAPESRRVVDVKLMIFRDLGERAGAGGVTATENYLLSAGSERRLPLPAAYDGTDFAGVT